MRYRTVAAEDRVPLVEQRSCDQVCRLPGGTSQPGGGLGERCSVAMGLECGNGAVDECFDQFQVGAHRSGARVVEGEEDRERRRVLSWLAGGLCGGAVDGEPYLFQPLVNGACLSYPRGSIRDIHPRDMPRGTCDRGGAIHNPWAADIRCRQRRLFAGSLVRR